MFNTTNSSSDNSVQINAVTGTIIKSYKDSFFKRFHLRSDLAKEIFNYGIADDKKIVVLQMMVCGDMEVIAEIITREDFDKIFKTTTESEED